MGSLKQLIAITAVNAEMLEARSQTNLAQITAQTPNVSLRPAGSDWRCRSPERRRPVHQRWSVPPDLRRCCSTHRSRST